MSNDMPVTLQSWRIRFRLNADGTKDERKSVEDKYRHSFPFLVLLGADGKAFGIYQSRRSLPDIAATTVTEEQKMVLAQRQKEVSSDFEFVSELSVPGLSFELTIDTVKSLPL